jgi:signal peptidase I, archaeal type
MHGAFHYDHNKNMPRHATSHGNLDEEPKLPQNAIIALWEDLYNKKQQSWLTILSGSMMPLLQIGDNVLIQSVKPVEIRPGDLIVFKSPDKLIVHRVIRRYNRLSFLQKGDNTTTAEIVSSTDIIGKVIAIRKGGNILYLNAGIWKFINLILTLFSCSVYYLKPETPGLKKIARIFFTIAKALLHRLLRL